MNTGLAPDGPLTAQVTNAALVGKAADWLAGGHRLALAFVMQTWGSSPRPAELRAAPAWWLLAER